MNSASIPSAAPAPPNLLKAFRAGFDAVTNHIELIFIPVGLDLFLWLGPHLHLSAFIDRVFGQALALPEAAGASMQEMVKASRDMWSLMAERFDLFSLLRSYPIGLPSLMAGIGPLENPLGRPLIIEVPSLGLSLVMWLLFTIIGLAFGALYFEAVAQAALMKKISWRQVVMEWPAYAWQVMLLAIFWFLLVLMLSLPFSCLITFILFSGVGIGRFALLFLAAIAAWIFLPLTFSPHGLFYQRLKVLASVRYSFNLTRFTMPTTMLFLLAVLVLSEGLDMLWRVPPEGSWLMLIGIMGHAFIATGLLSASFVYYRDAGQWVEKMLQQSRLNSVRNVRMT